MSPYRTIIAAAIIGEDDKTYWLPAQARHHDALRHMVKLGHSTPVVGEQGFMTTNLTFVDREEACYIARHAGQILLKTPPENLLFSEDLW